MKLKKIIALVYLSLNLLWIGCSNQEADQVTAQTDLHMDHTNKISSLSYSFCVESIDIKQSDVAGDYYTLKWGKEFSEDILDVPLYIGSITAVQLNISDSCKLQYSAKVSNSLGFFSTSSNFKIVFKKNSKIASKSLYSIDTMKDRRMDKARSICQKSISSSDVESSEKLKACILSEASKIPLENNALFFNSRQFFNALAQVTNDYQLPLKANSTATTFTVNVENTSE